MAQFETSVTIHTKGMVSSSSLANILQKEKEKVLGAKDRYIENGVIKERDYRFSSDETIGEPTEEQLTLYNALRVVEQHFRKMK